MLSLQKCRSLLGADCKLTDAELEQLRHELYAVADVAISDFCATRKAGCVNGQKSQNVSGYLSGIPEVEREAVEERAAILEFEGNLRKPEAERQAFSEWAQSKKTTGRKPKKLISKTPRKKARRRDSGKPH